MTFRTLSSHVDPASEIQVTLPWVHAASQPYADWLLGDGAAAREMLERWMRHPASEVFIGRVVVLVDDARQVGGFIAVSGAELAVCRTHDALAAVAASGPEDRSSLLARMRLGSALFPAAAADELYLSRIGVYPEARGRGYGRAIVYEHLRRGIRDGFRRFSLDVCSDNLFAIELYRSVGFRPERRHDVRELGMTYMRMVLETPRARERLRSTTTRPRRPEEPVYQEGSDRAV
jgi:ribosomal protein S18 acetylase RimI-like enzyme